MNDIKKQTFAQYIDRRYTFLPTGAQKTWPLAQVKSKRIEIKDESVVDRLMAIPKDFQPGYNLHVPQPINEMPF